jgi:BASS family bile acid:Na+ symporter
LQPADFLRPFQQPRALLAGVLAQVVLLPLVAFGLLRLFELQGDLAFGVMILSCCPGGITSNVMTKLARGDVALSISYTALASLITAVTLPLVLGLVGPWLLPQQDVALSILPLSGKVFALATLPVVLGVWVARIAPQPMARWTPRIGSAANALFALIVLATLVSQWDVFIANIPTLGPTLLALNLLMLAVGLGLGAALCLPQPQVTALAVEAGFQNGTIGIVVGALIAPALVEGQLNRFSLPSAVYGILMLLTIAPFLLWRRHTAAALVRPKAVRSEPVPAQR